MNTDVLIIGAGPTGLMAANQLQRFNIDFLIVDQKSGTTDQSRALAVTARSMELYQQLRLSDKVLEQASLINGFNIYSEGERKTDVTLNDFGKGFSDFSHFMNTFEQSKNEKILYENLIAFGKNVIWNNEFVSLQENAQGIIAMIRNIQTLETQTVHAKYIIGCDGGRSPVRHSCDFTFEGGTYENKFFVADTRLSWKLDYDKIIVVPSDKVLIIFFPLKGDKRIRVIGTLPVKFADKEDIDFKELEIVIKNATKLDLHFDSVGWHAIYKIHHRCVDTFSKGRVFLAGDAAHIHSPAGGQGMNTGLQDAHNLTWKMAFVLKGIAKSALLTTYNEERLPFAKSLLNSTDKGFTILAGDGWFVRNFRKYILLSLIGKLLMIKKVRVFAFKKISQIAYSYNRQTLAYSNTKQKLNFRAGDRFPYVGSGILKNFEAPVFHLACISNAPVLESDRNKIKNAFPFEVNIIEYTITEAWRKFGVTSTLYILVRPDHHILYIADKLDDTEIKNLLGKYF